MKKLICLLIPFLIGCPDKREEPMIRGTESVIVRNERREPENPLFRSITEKGLDYHLENGFFWLQDKSVEEVIPQRNVAQRFVSVNELEAFLYHQLKLINDPLELRALIFTESSGNPFVGCNRKNACGYLQLKKEAFYQTISLFYSQGKEAENFRNKYRESLEERIASLNSTFPDLPRFFDYFSLIKEKREEFNKRYRELGQEITSLRNEEGQNKEKRRHYFSLLQERENLGKLNKELFRLSRWLECQLLITYPKCQKEVKRLSSYLTKEKLDSLMANLTNKKEDWRRIFDLRNLLENVWDWIKTNPDPRMIKLHLYFGDTYLAHLKERLGDNDLAIEAYKRGFQNLNKKNRYNLYYSNQLSEVKEEFGRVNENVYGNENLECNKLNNPCFQREEPKYLKNYQKR